MGENGDNPTQTKISIFFKPKEQNSSELVSKKATGEGDSNIMKGKKTNRKPSMAVF